MSRPWIKSETIDKDELERIFGKVRHINDAISLRQWVEMAIDFINDAEEEKQEAKEKVRKYEEEINADTRVQEIKTKWEDYTKRMRYGFQVTPQEHENILAWQNRHDKERHNLVTNMQKVRAGGCIGGRYHYEFHPTSIGTAGSCICGRCQNQAFADSMGDINKYRELLKEYDAEFEFADLG